MTKRVLTAAYTVAALALVVIAIVLSLSPTYNVMYYFNSLAVSNEVSYQINGQNQGVLHLPTTLTGLEEDDVVSVYLESTGRDRENLLVEVDKAQCTLSINDEPYFSVGSEGTYPANQKQPSRSIDIVALPSLEPGAEIRLDYTISEVGSTLNIQPFYSGDHNLITKHVLMDNYLALILSFMLLVVGITLAIIGLVFNSRVELAIVLFWFGLACLACGCWTLFANDVILLFFSQFSAFYTISALGLYILPIPLGKFCLAYIAPYHSKLLNGVFYALCAFFVLAVISHLTGFISFGQIEPFFVVVGPLLLVFYVAVLLFARIKNNERVAPLFIFGMALFAGFAVFDGLARYIGIDSPVGIFFIVGLFFAAIVIALLMWEYLSDALEAMEKNAKLEADISAINRSLDQQRKHFEDFTYSVEETRRIRHDLRHQLVAIQGFISEHKDKEALEYIDNISKSIPSISEMLVCDNVAVNSLAVYYMAQAAEEGIQCDIKMAVPAKVGRVPNSDLSIIVGNLFENAIEACQHVELEKRFIKIRANVAANRFTLIIDNSYDGELRVHGSEFYSRKRKGFGVGIASVRSVVAKYDGGMKYETESGIFKTSLYVKIKEDSSKDA